MHRTPNTGRGRAARRAAGLVAALVMAGCGPRTSSLPTVRLTVLNPGHFHAALVQKHPLEGVCDTVRVYAPDGPELAQYLHLVEDFDGPWVQQVVRSDDYLHLLPEAGANEAVILAGKNRTKARTLLQAVQKGYHVLSDKPMALNPGDLELLREAYAVAARKGLVVQDLMTERYDTLNRATRQLVAGRMEGGSPEAPAVEMTSIHHFYKEVAGAPLLRPTWYYDVREQGEGIADVTTHLIDLLLWQCFPDEAIAPEEVEVVSAHHFPTLISRAQFCQSTGAEAFPPDLQALVCAGVLPVYSNGSLLFRVRDLYARITVRWDFAGGPDRFEADYHTRDGVVKVRQNAGTEGQKRLYDATGTDITPRSKATHEDHFSMVAAAFLDAVRGQTPLPAWEVPNTLAKYTLTTGAVGRLEE